jgi:iron-sulfur cluster assembly accessory protein
MVTITDAAAEKIKALLTEQDHTGYGLRMGAVPGGCSGFQYRLAFEEKEDGTDQVIQANGVKLFLDTQSSMYLEGAVLDYHDGLMGTGFTIDNPNAASTCNCGKSCGS